MLQDACNGLIYIDCMCNSGIYKDVSGNEVDGSPVRVARVLLDVARKYTGKTVELYFNDKDKNKVEELKKHLPADEGNFSIVTSVKDASELLTTIGDQLTKTSKRHYFLLYDPYDASIDWEALFPFFQNWGEVLINHMVSDPVRAIASAKRQMTKEKYEKTYLEDFERLLPYGTDKEAYEKRVDEIIKRMKGSRRYYVAAFPFYNTQNAHLYDLVHCTSNPAGFELYKQSAWKVFGAQSSTKHISSARQLKLQMDGTYVPDTDESCLTVNDIAYYIQKSFDGRMQVPLSEVWALLESHPIFPSKGFRSEIKDELKTVYGVRVHTATNRLSGKRELFVDFVCKYPRTSIEGDIAKGVDAT
jgi:three-Cys-motif partner protein